MYQLFLENKLFQVQALNHLEVILLSRAAWSRHAYETCLSALWKISYITSLLELLFCYFKEMVGFDQLWFPKEKNLPSLYALQKIEYNFVVQMSHLPSPVHLACHQERRDDKLPLCDVAQPWLRWWWLVGWQARENSFGSESQCFLFTQGGVESLKWLSATYLVKLLGISKFTPAAVYYHIQVIEMCTFLNQREWEKTKANITPKKIKLWLAFWLNFTVMLTVESKFVPVDERKENWIFSLFSTGAYGIQTQPKQL